MSFISHILGRGSEINKNKDPLVNKHSVASTKESLPGREVSHWGTGGACLVLLT